MCARLRARVTVCMFVCVSVFLCACVCYQVCHLVDNVIRPLSLHRPLRAEDTPEAAGEPCSEIRMTGAFSVGQARPPPPPCPSLLHPFPLLPFLGVSLAGPPLLDASRRRPRRALL